MERKYKEIHITRKGKRRKLITYNDESQRLKHQKIKIFLEANLYFSKFTKAYLKNSSIFLNAKAHMYNDIFFKFDIKNFFNSIDHKILIRILHKELNVVNKESVELLDVANLVRECVASEKGLPLGLITSPILANIYLKEFDNILYGKLKRRNLENIIYTRYADDLVISFKGTYEKNFLMNLMNEVQEEIECLLNRYKLKVNKNKCSIINLNVSNHVRITGISIIKSEDNFRSLSIGKKKVMKLFDDTFSLVAKLNNCDFVSSEELYEIQRIKGLNSFILSVHKKGYNEMLSSKMIDKINALGFNSLSELIDSINVN